MKKNNLQELRNKPLAELEKFIKDGREKVRSMKFDLAAGKVKNVKELKKIKKEVARILTIIKEGKNHG